MPIKYECYKCKVMFSYTEVEIEVDCPVYEDRFINVVIPCKHKTYTSGLGSTGDDYICGDCIRKAVIKKGVS